MNSQPGAGKFIMKDASGKDTSVTQTGQLGASHDGASKRSNILRQDQQSINSTFGEKRDVTCRASGFFFIVRNGC